MEKEIMQKIKSEIVTANDASEIIGVTRATLRNYDKKGILSPIKAGGKVRYLLKDIEDFMYCSTKKSNS